MGGMVTIALEERELRLLLELMSQRIAQADQAGISRNDPSSLFRTNLFRKLAGAEPVQQEPLPRPKAKMVG